MEINFAPLSQFSKISPVQGAGQHDSMVSCAADIWQWPFVFFLFLGSTYQVHCLSSDMVELVPFLEEENDLAYEYVR